MSIITSPDIMDFIPWAANLALDLTNLDIDIPDNPKEWRKWAVNVIYFNKLDIPLPDDSIYQTDESWRDWAKVFINSYNPNDS